jgi:hypothetical protein
MRHQFMVRRSGLSDVCAQVDLSPATHGQGAQLLTNRVTLFPTVSPCSQPCHLVPNCGDNQCFNGDPTLNRFTNSAVTHAVSSSPYGPFVKVPSTAAEGAELIPRQKSATPPCYCSHSVAGVEARPCVRSNNMPLGCPFSHQCCHA